MAIFLLEISLSNSVNDHAVIGLAAWYFFLLTFKKSLK